MIKIKDNVDLKELEKFGFKYRPYKNEQIIYGKETYSDGSCIYIYECDRSIYGENGTFYKNELPEETLDTLYDLIKADLVEKI